MSDLTFTQGDTSPPIDGALKKSDGTAFPLTNVASVKFQMRKENDHRYAVNAAAVVVSSSAGTVRYDWGANDLSVPGEYVTQWELTYTNGRIQTTNPPNTITVRRQ